MDVVQAYRSIDPLGFLAPPALVCVPMLYILDSQLILNKRKSSEEDKLIYTFYKVGEEVFQCQQ